MNDELEFEFELPAQARESWPRAMGAIPLLVALHVVGSLAALIYAANSRGDPFEVYAGVCAAQGSIIALFFLLAKRNPDLLMTLLGVLVVSLLLGPIAWIFAVPIVGFSVVAMFTTLPLAFWYGQLTREPPPKSLATEDRPIQFSLKGIMTSMVVVAFIVLIGKWLRAVSRDEEFGTTVGGGLALLTLPAPLAWAVLRRTARRRDSLGVSLALTVPFAALVAADPSWETWRGAVAFVATYWIALSISLWLVRRAGYRIIPLSDWSRWGKPNKLSSAFAEPPSLLFDDHGPFPLPTLDANDGQHGRRAFQADADAEAARE